jgi:hypothetical protein
MVGTRIDLPARSALAGLALRPAKPSGSGVVLQRSRWRGLVAVLPIALGLVLTAAPLAAQEQDCCDLCCCETAVPAPNADAFPLETLVFHLPLHFNDGSPVPEALLEDVLADVVALAGGFTYSEATGGWLFKGRLYREPVWVVKVGLEKGKIDAFVELVETRLKTDFKQEAVWVEDAGEAAIL